MAETHVPKNSVSRSIRLLKTQSLPHQHWGLEFRTSLVIYPLGLQWRYGYEVVVPEARKVVSRANSFTVAIPLMRLVGNFRNVLQEVLGLVCWTSLLVSDAILRRPLP